MRFIGIDIDDHAEQGERYLTQLYTRVCHVLGYPSLLVKTRRGMHAFWFLNEDIPRLVLIPGIKKQLGDLQVEILPTPSHALRIPVEKNLLHVETLRFLGSSFVDAIATAEVYHPSSVLPVEYTRDAVRVQLSDRVPVVLGAGEKSLEQNPLLIVRPDAFSSQSYYSSGCRRRVVAKLHLPLDHWMPLSHILCDSDKILDSCC